MFRQASVGLDVRTDRLFGMDVCDVIDVTPESWRQEEGRLWRGGSVAALALKLAQGDYLLNPREKSPSRGRGFNASYSYADAHGYASRGGHWRQFGSTGREGLAEATGQSVPKNFIGPGIIYSFRRPPETIAQPDGYEFVKVLTPIDAIDPYSLAALEGLLEVEVPRLPQHNPALSAIRAGVGALAALASFG